MNYVIVDGGNRVGKSVAVKVAASRLSASRTVRWSACDEGGTAVGLLRGIFGLDTAPTFFLRVLNAVATLSLTPAEASMADLRSLVLASDASRQEPVFVVELAERLEIRELKSLLNFAKELVDMRRGRFIFVFAPTDKLDTIGDFGAATRATVVHVGELNDEETTAFLKNSGCGADQSAALYGLIGGHLPHLLSYTVHEYCRGTKTRADVEGAFRAKIDAQVDSVNCDLGVGAACRGLCGVATKEWPSPGVLDVLLKKHLVVKSLKKGVYMDSQLVRAYVQASCSCNPLIQRPAPS